MHAHSHTDLSNVLIMVTDDQGEPIGACLFSRKRITHNISTDIFCLRQPGEPILPSDRSPATPQRNR